jgi:hypothetical protein
MKNLNSIILILLLITNNVHASSDENLMNWFKHSTGLKAFTECHMDAVERLAALKVFLTSNMSQYDFTVYKEFILKKRDVMQLVDYQNKSDQEFIEDRRKEYAKLLDADISYQQQMHIHEEALKSVPDPHLRQQETHPFTYETKIIQ